LVYGGPQVGIQKAACEPFSRHPGGLLLIEMTMEEFRHHMNAKDGKPVGFRGSYILNTINMIGQGPIEPKKKKLKKEFILGGADYARTDTTDIPPHVKARLVPAIKHPQTGKIYLGKRGDDHSEVMERHGFVDSNRRLKVQGWDSTIHTGYYDHVGKRFYTHHEAGFHASDLMSGPQRFRKYGSESHGNSQAS